MTSPGATIEATLDADSQSAARPKLAFRSSFPVLWRWTSTLCGLLGAFIYALAWFGGQPISAPPTIGMAILLGIFFAIAAVLFPVYVTADGVRCYNFFGAYNTIPFVEMEKFKVSSMLGLKYVVVNSADKIHDIWIPLYLYDRAGFKFAVRERAGASHPLVEVLERYS